MLFYALLTVLLPAAYIVYLFKRGLVTDLHMRRRSERIRPTAFHIVCLLLVTIALLLAPDAPRMLRFLALLQTLQALLFLAITLSWKISAHAGTAALVATLTLLLYGPTLWPILFLVPLIAWSRVRLGRHTVAQTVAGAVLGMITTAATYILFGVS
jgi:membrane-associated phospholipid phosphatase